MCLSEWQCELTAILWYTKFRSGLFENKQQMDFGWYCTPVEYLRTLVKSLIITESIAGIITGNV